MTLISAPAAAACLEEALCLTGCREYVVFGSCGTLNSQLTDGKMIVPTWAYRDEGLSYHYVAASEYIEMKDWKRVADFFEEKKVPYVTGRIWTTDAIYRETSGKAEKLRKDGCIAVEMELAGMQAVCEYHDLTLKAFLFASDCLDPEEWHNELLGSEREWDTQVKCFLLALDLALKFPLEERMTKQRTEIDRRFNSVGIDGCRGGWITAVICNGELDLRRFVSLKEVTDELPFDACMIDMVIGLQGNDKQVRPDDMARKILKGRESTVFTAPCRKAVYEVTKERRFQVNIQVLHKKFSIQTDAIIPKMREVDEFLQSNTLYKNRIQESHPEVCFARLKGEVLLTSKHKAEGIKERIAVLSGYLSEVTEDWVTEHAKKMKCRKDDITDAVCLAIVANLSMQGKTETIPPKPVMDDTGLLMQMVIPKERIAI